MWETPENNTPDTKINQPADNADASKEKDEDDVVDDTQAALNTFLKDLIESKLWKNDPRVNTVIDKINTMQKVWFWLQLKGVVNTVLWFFGIAKAFNPNMQIPTNITDIQDKVTKIWDQIDGIESKIWGITSWAMIPWMTWVQLPEWTSWANQLTWDTTIDTALTDLDTQSQALKKQNGITPALYKAWFATLLQKFIVSVKANAPSTNNNAINNTLSGVNTNQVLDYDEDDYDNLPWNTTDVKESEFTFWVPIWSPIWDKKIVITSGIGPRHVKNNPNASQDHRWVDIAVPLGTDIVVPIDGKIVHVWYEEKWAWNYIDVDHWHFITRYFHLSKTDVKEWDIIKKWQKIGESGDTWNAKWHPHLHYEVRDKTQIVDANKSSVGKYKVLNPEDFMDVDGDGKIVAMTTYNLQKNAT